MNSFFSKKIFYSSAILFFAFLFFVLPPLIGSNIATAQSSYSCPSNQYDDFGNCLSPSSALTCPSHLAPSADGTACVCQNPSQIQIPNPNGTGGSICVDDETGYQANTAAGARVSQETAATIGGQTQNTTGAEKLDCSAWVALATGNAMRCTTVWFGNSALWLSSWFLDLASVLLNQSIKFNLNIADFIQKTPGITLAWGTIRDMSNIIFIFALLWISIQNILQIGDGKKLIPSIIIAALLINFSMFFTKVIIDTSNIVAFQFYSGIIDPTQTGNFSAGGISDKFFQLTKIQSVFASNSVDFFQILTISLMGVVFILITAFSFLSVAFIFLSRAIILILLLPLSPFAYVAGLIPKTAKYSKMWWDQLWEQVLVAPVFLMLMWMILIILGGGNNGLNTSSGIATTEGVRSTIATYTENTNLAAALTASGGVSSTVATYTENVSGSNMASALTSPDVNTIGVIFSFLIAIGLLLAAVKVTRELSGSAGSKISGMLSVGAGALAGGAGGYMARQSIGRLASLAANNETFKNVAANNKYARLALQSTVGVAKSSFDVRAAGETPLIGGLGSKLAGAAAGATGAKLDLGQKPKDLTGGFRGDIERAEKERGKERADIAKLLEAKTVKLSAKETGEVTLTDEEKAGKSSEEINKLQAEKLKKAEANKQNVVTRERQGAYFEQLKKREGEVVPQILKMGDVGGTKKAEKEIESKYKSDQETSKLEGTIKSLMGSNKSVKEAIDSFTKESIDIQMNLDKLGDNGDKNARAKLLFERETAKNNARNLQRFVDSLERLKAKEDNKKIEGK